MTKSVGAKLAILKFSQLSPCLDVTLVFDCHRNDCGGKRMQEIAAKIISIMTDERARRVLLFDLRLQKIRCRNENLQENFFCHSQEVTCPLCVESRQKLTFAYFILEIKGRNKKVSELYSACT